MSSARSARRRWRRSERRSSLALDLKVSSIPGNSKGRTLLDDIERNAQKAANAAAYDAARRYRDDVAERLADAGERFRPIREHLKLLHNERGEQDVYLVVADVRRVDEEEIDKELTVVDVVPKVGEDWLRVLQTTSPWPMTMLPIRPSRDQAELVAKMVREDEMERLRRDKAPILEKVLSVLRSYGIDPTIDTDDVEVEIVVDTNWEAIRAEFGLDGFRRVPVWQPALRAVMREKQRTVQVMEKALTRPPTTPTDAKASAVDVAATRDFRDRIKV